VTIQNTHNSAHIVSSEYDPEQLLMKITFAHNNATYAYHPVPPQVYTEFVKAKSPGKFLHLHVKPNFNATRLN